MANVVGDRFQITIDRRLRRQLGIRPGDRAIERIEEGRLIVSFMPAPHSESLLGAFRRPDLPPITDWQQVKDRAWTARASEMADILKTNNNRSRR
jgi:bifunctional DNA-binding transcriptional regulator/antitoxin component of YhaV-PrlF toxin-antitoxin module